MITYEQLTYLEINFQLFLSSFTRLLLIATVLPMSRALQSMSSAVALRPWLKRPASPLLIDLASTFASVETFPADLHHYSYALQPNGTRSQQFFAWWILF